MLERLRHSLHLEEIPRDIQVLSHLVGMRWFGWGFAEALIPVLIFTYSSNFAQTGILSSIANIIGILALPFIGLYADRIRATSIIILGATIFVFVGSGYFLYGLTGSVFFLILTFFADGIATPMVRIGGSTYIQRHATKEKIATVFGFDHTVTNSWWIVAALLGAFLVQFFSITELLLMIVPFSILHILFILPLRRKEKCIPVPGYHLFSVNPFKEIKSWNIPLKSIMIFNFVIAFTGAIILVFLPIDVYQGGGSLSQIILLGVAGALPTLAGWKLGRYFDTKGYKVIGSALFVLSSMLLLVSFFSDFLVRIVAMFVIGLILELLAIGSTEIMTLSAESEHLGRINGVMLGIATIGTILGPIVAGYLIEATSATGVFISLAMFIFAAAIMFKALDRKGVWILSGNRSTRMHGL